MRSKWLFLAVGIMGLTGCSRLPPGCQQHGCHWVKGAIVAKTGYFTCYARNTQRTGVWFYTSHNERRAQHNALNRCAQYSRYPSACYFDYCWLW